MSLSFIEDTLPPSSFSFCIYEKLFRVWKHPTCQLEYPNTNSPPTTTHASLSIVCKAHYHSCVVSSVFIFEHIIEILSAISLTCSFDLKLIDKEPCTFCVVPLSRFLFLAYMSRACSSAIHKYQGTLMPPMVLPSPFLHVRFLPEERTRRPLSSS
jgi:hypothetical protein